MVLAAGEMHFCIKNLIIKSEERTGEIIVTYHSLDSHAALSQHLWSHRNGGDGDIEGKGVGIQQGGLVNPVTVVQERTENGQETQIKKRVAFFMINNRPSPP